MFQFQSIALTHFKNYLHQSFSFSKKIIGICGNNGVGKTNLLDAIYYLCFTKSYFTHADLQCTMLNKQGFRIDGKAVMEYDCSKDLQLTCILRETGKKEFSVNGIHYNRMSEHIGRLPCVIITPDDTALITGGSEGRRKLIDTLLCQLNPDYLQQLIAYNRLLQQRNALLKIIANGREDASLLQVINTQLSERGQYIYLTRHAFLKDFLPQVESHYYAISLQNESITLSYQSQLHNDSFSKLLSTSFSKDLLLQRTTSGPHRDDIVFHLSAQPFKQLASQGQRKSLLFAIKLTEFEVLQQQKHFPPVLLLDDLFEKLDAGRMRNLLREVCIQKNGQVFITDTHKERLEKNLSAIGADYEMLEL